MQEINMNVSSRVRGTLIILSYTDREASSTVKNRGISANRFLSIKKSATTINVNNFQYIQCMSMISIVEILP